jgi:cytochrome c
MKKFLTILAITSAVALMAGDITPITNKCKACHGVDGGKMAPMATRLMNTLTKDEFIAAINGYKAKTYGGKGKVLMYPQVGKLTAEDITALADFYIK